jgi:membrane protease YdiL (CAAX protease family)
LPAYEARAVLASVLVSLRSSAVAYLAAVSLAEYLTAALNPRIGLPLHGLILVVLLLHGSNEQDERKRAFIWCVATAPLIRILSLTLPVSRLPLIFWFAVISLPVFAATFAAARAVGYTRRDVGLVLRLRDVPLSLSMIVLGIGLGVGEYLILRPPPLIGHLTLEEFWLPALVLTICTGLEEELLFRGLLQRAATDVLGYWRGALFATLLFTALHIGYLSALDLLYVFIAGGLFVLLSRAAKSIVPATCCHAGVNLGLFLIWPHVFPILQTR